MSWLLPFTIFNYNNVVNDLLDDQRKEGEKIRHFVKIIRRYINIQMEQKRGMTA